MTLINYVKLETKHKILHSLGRWRRFKAFCRFTGHRTERIADLYAFRVLPQGGLLRTGGVSNRTFEKQ